MLSENKGIEENIPVADFLDSIILKIGKTVSWANFVLIVVTLVQVVLRYGFHHGLVKLEELEWYLYSFAFMIGFSYALTTNSHVRVDVLQGRFSRTARELIDIFGHVFLLLPFLFVLIYYGCQFTHSSFALNEHSNAPLGLPYRWIIKGVIPVSMSLMVVATVSRIIRSAVIIKRVRHGC